MAFQNTALYERTCFCHGLVFCSIFRSFFDQTVYDQFNLDALAVNNNGLWLGNLIGGQVLELSACVLRSIGNRTNIC
eukprot:4916974-Amphidinium_carterae.1